MLMLLILLSCQTTVQESTPEQAAQDIIDAAILAAGGERYTQSSMTFTFRDKTYMAARNGGRYQFERKIKEGTDFITDRLDNTGFERTVNGELITLTDTTAEKYANSVNSVIYFASLPYGLNDKAVHKKHLGNVQIKGQPYHKVQVSFSEEGGGKDFEDTFIYWIHEQEHTVDYLAYKYHVDEGGIRFREAFNARKVEGIRFVDYNNFKPKGDYKTIDLATTDQLFEQGKLQLLSKIILEDVTVGTDL